MPAWLLGLRFGGFFLNVDEVERKSALAARRSTWSWWEFGGAAKKNESSLLRALNFFLRRRRFEKSSCKGDGRQWVRARETKKKNQKPSWRGQSVLSRLIREEHSR